MIQTWFDNIALGDRLTTRARTITETDIVQFAMLSGDWYALHTNIEFARTTVFGERIAHGMLILSIMTGLVDLVPPYVVAFYGMDRVRFVRPTKIGDTIHAESEVTALEPRDATSGLVTWNVVIKNQRDDVVIAAVLKLVVAREGGTG